MTDICVIFDLDGTLVDSETLCNQAFLDLLPGIGDPVTVLVQRYRGLKLAAILADLSVRLGRALPADFESVYRSRVAKLFDTQLRPTPGAPEMLRATPLAKCVASSGPREKIARALAVTALAPYFGENIFSAYEVGSWKPQPGLFLHAAKAMGFPPNRCVVVEDSDVGIEAAAAAGMKALRFRPSDEDGGSAPADFSHMAELPALLAGIAAQCR